MGHTLNIMEWKNTSEYPDAWAKPCIAWICERLGVTTIRVRIVKGVLRSGCGNAVLGGTRMFMRIRRRNHRKEWRYSTIKWDDSRIANTSLEAFVFLAAHEIRHLSSAGAAEYRMCHKERKIPGKGRWVQRAEVLTNRAAQTILDEYRQEGRSYLLGIYRKHLEFAKHKTIKIAKVRQKMSLPEEKLKKIEEKEERWTKKLERAERALAKLRRQKCGILVAQKRAANR